jgi:hypothetical protein
MVKHDKTQKRQRAEQMHVCQNCRKEFPESKLQEIGLGGFWERVSPGEIVPSGECPECQALCHPKETARVLIDVVGGVAHVVSAPFGVTVEIHDYDCDAIDDAADIKRDKSGDRYILSTFSA